MLVHKETQAEKLVTAKEIVPMTQCSCSGCHNVFFVRSSSTEFLPSLCCYCGMKFDGYQTLVKEY